MLNITNYQRNEIKTTKKYYLAPVRMAIMKKQKITSVDKDVKTSELLYMVCRNIKWYIHYGK